MSSSESGKKNKAGSSPALKSTSAKNVGRLTWPTKADRQSMAKRLQGILFPRAAGPASATSRPPRPARGSVTLTLIDEAPAGSEAFDIRLASALKTLKRRFGLRNDGMTHLDLGEPLTPDQATDATKQEPTF